MKISELIKSLTHALERHGDLEIARRYPDSDAVNDDIKTCGVVSVGDNAGSGDRELEKDYDGQKRRGITNIKKVYLL